MCIFHRGRDPYASSLMPLPATPAALLPVARCSVHSTERSTFDVDEAPGQCFLYQSGALMHGLAWSSGARRRPTITSIYWACCSLCLHELHGFWAYMCDPIIAFLGFLDCLPFMECSLFGERCMKLQCNAFCPDYETFCASIATDGPRADLSNNKTSLLFRIGPH